jgi:hypothetical protein
MQGAATTNQPYSASPFDALAGQSGFGSVPPFGAVSDDIEEPFTYENGAAEAAKQYISLRKRLAAAGIDPDTLDGRPKEPWYMKPLRGIGGLGILFDWLFGGALVKMALGGAIGLAKGKGLDWAVMSGQEVDKYAEQDDYASILGTEKGHWHAPSGKELLIMLGADQDSDRRGKIDPIDVAGLLVEVAADPSTWFSFGLTSAAEAATKGGSRALVRTSAELLDNMGEQFAKHADDVAGIAEKIVEATGGEVTRDSALTMIAEFVRPIEVGLTHEDTLGNVAKKLKIADVLKSIGVLDAVPEKVMGYSMSEALDMARVGLLPDAETVVKGLSSSADDTAVKAAEQIISQTYETQEAFRNLQRLTAERQFGDYGGLRLKVPFLGENNPAYSWSIVPQKEIDEFLDKVGFPREIAKAWRRSTPGRMLTDMFVSDARLKRLAQNDPVLGNALLSLKEVSRRRAEHEVQTLLGYLIDALKGSDTEERVRLLQHLEVPGQMSATIKHIVDDTDIQALAEIAAVGAKHERLVLTGTRVGNLAAVLGDDVAEDVAYGLGYVSRASEYNVGAGAYGIDPIGSAKKVVENAHELEKHVRDSIKANKSKELRESGIEKYMSKYDPFTGDESRQLNQEWVEQVRRFDNEDVLAPEHLAYFFATATPEQLSKYEELFSQITDAVAHLRDARLLRWHSGDVEPMALAARTRDALDMQAAVRWLAAQKDGLTPEEHAGAIIDSAARLSKASREWRSLLEAAQQHLQTLGDREAMEAVSKYVQLVGSGEDIPEDVFKAAFKYAQMAAAAQQADPIAVYQNLVDAATDFVASVNFPSKNPQEAYEMARDVIAHAREVAAKASGLDTVSLDTALDAITRPGHVSSYATTFADDDTLGFVFRRGTLVDTAVDSGRFSPQDVMDIRNRIADEPLAPVGYVDHLVYNGDSALKGTLWARVEDPDVVREMPAVLAPSAEDGHRLLRLTATVPAEPGQYAPVSVRFKKVFVADSAEPFDATLPIDKVSVSGYLPEAGKRQKGLSAEQLQMLGYDAIARRDDATGEVVFYAIPGQHADDPVTVLRSQTDGSLYAARLTEGPRTSGDTVVNRLDAWIPNARYIGDAEKRDALAYAVTISDEQVGHELYGEVAKTLMRISFDELEDSERVIEFDALLTRVTRERAEAARAAYEAAQAEYLESLSKQRSEIERASERIAKEMQEDAARNPSERFVQLSDDWLKPVSFGKVKAYTEVVYEDKVTGRRVYLTGATDSPVNVGGSLTSPRFVVVGQKSMRALGPENTAWLVMDAISTVEVAKGADDFYWVLPVGNNAALADLLSRAGWTKQGGVVWLLNSERDSVIDELSSIADNIAVAKTETAAAAGVAKKAPSLPRRDTVAPKVVKSRKKFDQAWRAQRPVDELPPEDATIVFDSARRIGAAFDSDGRIVGILPGYANPDAIYYAVLEATYNAFKAGKTPRIPLDEVSRADVGDRLLRLLLSTGYDQYGDELVLNTTTFRRFLKRNNKYADKRIVYEVLERRGYHTRTDVYLKPEVYALPADALPEEMRPAVEAATRQLDAIYAIDSELRNALTERFANELPVETVRRLGRGALDDLGDLTDRQRAALTRLLRGDNAVEAMADLTQEEAMAVERYAGVFTKLSLFGRGIETGRLSATAGPAFREAYDIAGLKLTEPVIASGVAELSDDVRRVAVQLFELTPTELPEEERWRIARMSAILSHLYERLQDRGIAPADLMDGIVDGLDKEILQPLFDELGRHEGWRFTHPRLGKPIEIGPTVSAEAIAAFNERLSRPGYMASLARKYHISAEELGDFMTRAYSASVKVQQALDSGTFEGMTKSERYYAMKSLVAKELGLDPDVYAKSIDLADILVPVDIKDHYAPHVRVDESSLPAWRRWFGLIEDPGDYRNVEIYYRPLNTKMENVQNMRTLRGAVQQINAIFGPEMFMEDPAHAIAVYINRAVKALVNDDTIRGLIQMRDMYGRPLLRAALVDELGRFYAPPGWDLLDIDEIQRIWHRDRDVFMSPLLEEVYALEEKTGGRIMLIAPQEVADEFAKGARRFFGSESFTKLQAVFEKVQGTWKGYATVLRPSFHVRNAATNVVLNAYAGLYDPSYYSDAMRLQRVLARVGDFMHDAFKSDGTVFVSPGAAYELLLGGGRIDDISDIAGDFEPWELIDALYDNGIIGTGRSAGDVHVFTEQQLDRLRPASRAMKFYSPEWFPVAAGRKIGSTIEENARLAHFLWMLDRTKDFRAAAWSVRKYLFDYTELTDFERKVLRPLIPFYSWLRKNAELTGYMLMHKPFIPAVGTRVMSWLDKQAMQDISPEWAEDMGAFHVPGLTVGKLNALFNKALPFLNLDTTSEEPIMVSLDAPWLDLLDYNAKDMFSALSPVVRVPTELLTNRNVYYGTEIKEGEYDLKRAPSSLQSIDDDIMKYADEQTKKRWEAVLRRLGVHRRQSDGVLLADPVATYVFRSMFPFFDAWAKAMPTDDPDASTAFVSFMTGIKVIPIDEWRERYYDYLERTSELNAIRKRLETLGIEVPTLNELSGARPRKTVSFGSYKASWRPKIGRRPGDAMSNVPPIPLSEDGVTVNEQAMELLK